MENLGGAPGHDQVEVCESEWSWWRWQADRRGCEAVVPMQLVGKLRVVSDFNVSY